MADWYEMSDMTSREFAQAKPELRLALVPVGATEQHGPNLGLGTASGSRRPCTQG